MSRASLKLLMALWLLLVMMQLIGISYFYFERHLIQQGQLWRLLTGHLVHSNNIHLLLNMCALALVLMLFDKLVNNKQWLALILVSAIIQSIAFYYLLPQVQSYVGLSGVIHSLYVFGAVRLLAQPKERSLACLLLALVTLKLLTENVGHGISVTEQMIASHVLVEAHLYGAVIGLVSIFILQRFSTHD